MFIPQKIKRRIFLKIFSKPQLLDEISALVVSKHDKAKFVFDFLILHLLALGPISGLYDIFSSEDFVSAQISYLFIGFEAVCVPYS